MAVQFDVGELGFPWEAFVAEKPFQVYFSIGTADAMVGVSSSFMNVSYRRVRVLLSGSAFRQPRSASVPVAALRLLFHGK